jgi:hypothetical protein
MIRGEDSDDKCNNVRLIRLMKRWSLSIHPSCSLTCAAEHRVGMKPGMSRGMPNWDSTVVNGQNYSHVMFSAVGVTIRYKLFGGCYGAERSLDQKG